jgi:hypothetical protein
LQWQQFADFFGRTSSVIEMLILAPLIVALWMLGLAMTFFILAALRGWTKD